jgi:hypothetical protein
MMRPRAHDPAATALGSNAGDRPLQLAAHDTVVRIEECSLVGPSDGRQPTAWDSQAPCDSTDAYVSAVACRALRSGG